MERNLTIQDFKILKDLFGEYANSPIGSPTRFYDAYKEHNRNNAFNFLLFIERTYTCARAKKIVAKFKPLLKP
jgi:hypothetical protein